MKIQPLQQGRCKRQQEDEAEYLSISQTLAQDKSDLAWKNGMINQDLGVGDSARGGASTRRQMFSENCRKEIQADLSSLRNKPEENEDVPITEYPPMSQDVYSLTRNQMTVEDRGTLHSSAKNMTKIMINETTYKNQNYTFDDRDEFSLSGSSSDSSNDICSREVKIGHSSSEICGITVRHCEDDIEEEYRKQSDGKQSYSGLDVLLGHNNSVSRSFLPSLLPNTLNNPDPFFQGPYKNDNMMIHSEGFYRKNTRSGSLLVPSGVGSINEISYQADGGKNHSQKLRIGHSFEENTLPLATNWQDRISHKLPLKQLTYVPPIQTGTFRRGLRGQSAIGSQLLGAFSPANVNNNSTNQQPKRKRGHSASKNYLSIIYFVKKFENMLKTASTAYKFRSMTKKHFDMIGDVSSNYRYYRLRSYLYQDAAKWHEHIWHRFQSVFRQVIWNPFSNHIFTQVVVKTGAHKIRVLQPESFAKQLWDIFAILIIITNIFFIPIRLSFSLNSGEYLSSVASFVLYSFPLFVLILDLFINLNTAFYKNGLLIFDRSEIFHNYMRTHLLWDSIVILPYLLSVFTGVIELKAFVLFRFNKIMDTIKQFEERLNLSDSQTAYVGLCKLIFLITFVAHMCGCGFFLVSQIEKYYGYSPTWTEKYGFDMLSIWSQYITSLYWSVITMITLGYGDIVPINTIERSFIVLVTMVACGVFGFSINKIGHLILEIGKKENEQKKKINMLMDLMHKRGLSNIPLLMKVRRNFQYLLNQAQENNQEGAKFLMQLDPNLKNEVMRDIYGKMLENKKMFKLNFSQYLIDQLCLKMKEHTYGPEDVILSENNIVDKIFFILQGEAMSFINLTSKTKKSASGMQSSENTFQALSNLNKGDFFGEKAFFSNSKSEYGVKACTVVTVAYFSMKDMMECLQERQSDLEKFCVLRDNLQIYNITKGLGVRCFGCNKYTHTIIHCPHSKYIPNQEKVLYLNGISTNQERQKFTRRKLHISNILAIQEDVHNAAIKFIIETFGIDTINQYFEERDNDWQYLHSPHTNLNAKVIENAMNKASFQITHQPSTNNIECLISSHSTNNLNTAQSPKQKMVLFPHLQTPSNSLFLQGIQDKGQLNYLSKLGGTNQNLSEQPPTRDEVEIIHTQPISFADIQLLNLPNFKEIQIEFPENIINEDTIQKQQSQISTQNAQELKISTKGASKIENSDLEPGGTIPVGSDATQQFLITPISRPTQKKLSWLVSQQTNQTGSTQQQQPQRQASISSQKNTTKQHEKDKSVHLASSQGNDESENEHEKIKFKGNAFLMQQYQTVSSVIQNQPEGQIFEKQKSKRTKDYLSQDGPSEHHSHKEHKSHHNNHSKNCHLNIEIEEEGSYSFNVISDFDCGKEYQVYFPHNNLREVLSNYNSHFLVVSPLKSGLYNHRQDMQRLLKGIKKIPKAPKRFREKKSIFEKSENNTKQTSHKSLFNEDNQGEFQHDSQQIQINPFLSANNLPHETDKNDNKTQKSSKKVKNNAIELINQQLLSQSQILDTLNMKSANIISQTEQIISQFAFPNTQQYASPQILNEQLLELNLNY